MAELATIARPYADALFKASLSDLSSAAVWVDELKEIASNAQLLQFADNPNVSDDQVFSLITGLVVLPEMAKNFLRTVIEKRPGRVFGCRGLQRVRNGRCRTG
jgi:F-type H+-transporting ATPase subunit delta